MSVSALLLRAHLPQNINFVQRHVDLKNPKSKIEMQD